MIKKGDIVNYKAKYSTCDSVFVAQNDMIDGKVLVKAADGKTRVACYWMLDLTEEWAARSGDIISAVRVNTHGEAWALCDVMGPKWRPCYVGAV